MDEFLGLLAVLIPLIIMLFEKKAEKTKGKKGGKGRKGTVVSEQEAVSDVFPQRDVPLGTDTSTATVEAVSLEEYLPEQPPVCIGNAMRNMPVGETLITRQRSEDIISVKDITSVKEDKEEGVQGEISLRDAIIHQAILERKYF